MIENRCRLCKRSYNNTIHIITMREFHHKYVPEIVKII